MKHGDTHMGVVTQASGQITDRVRQIYGNAVANELIPFEVADKSLGFTAAGSFSNANYSVKKTTLLLFINRKKKPSSNYFFWLLMSHDHIQMQNTN